MCSSNRSVKASHCYRLANGKTQSSAIRVPIGGYVGAVQQGALLRFRVEVAQKGAVSESGRFITRPGMIARNHLVEPSARAALASRDCGFTIGGTPSCLGIFWLRNSWRLSPGTALGTSRNGNAVTNLDRVYPHVSFYRGRPAWVGSLSSQNAGPFPCRRWTMRATRQDDGGWIVARVEPVP